MPSLDEIMDARGEPVAPDSRPEITDADRAANPIGAARAERDRDQQGRFAPKTEDKPQDGDEPAVTEGDQPQASPDQRRDGKVPQGALSAERGKRKEAESEAAALRRELAEMRGQLQGMRQSQPQVAQPEPQAPPEFWQDPNAAMDYRLRQTVDPVQQQMQRMTMDWSQRFAVQQHGEEAVRSAVQSLAELRQNNPTEFQRMEAHASQSMDPVGDIVRWHLTQQTQKKLQQFGGDPEAYIKAEVERRLAEAQGEAVEPQQPAPQAPARLPTPFAGRPSNGPRGGQGYGGPRALSDIMPRG